MIKLFLPVLVILLNLTLAQAGDSAAEDIAEQSPQQIEASIVATTIREKGYSCHKVANMERIERHDAGIRSAWRVDCDGGSYQVIYVGDSGYQVKRVNK